MERKFDVAKPLKDLPSPNMVEAFILGDDFYYFRCHEVEGSPMGYLQNFSDADLNPNDPLGFLTDRILGCMELLVVSEKWGNNKNIGVYRDRLALGKSRGNINFGNPIRLAYFQVTDNNTCEEVANAVDSGIPLLDIFNSLDFTPSKDIRELYSTYPLQPEHYSWDAKEGKDYFTELEKDMLDQLGYEESSEDEYIDTKDEELVDDDSEDTEDIEEDKGHGVKISEEDLNKSSKRRLSELSSTEKKILEGYATTYSSAKSVILKYYELMFTSAFQLKRPYGVVTKEDGKANIVTIKGSSRESVDPTSKLLHSPLVNNTINRLNLTVLPTRNVWDIAMLVYKGESLDGKYVCSKNDRLYFPNKMLEYAYGLGIPDEMHGGRTNYPPSANAGSWEEYSSTVNKSLDIIMKVLILTVIDDMGIKDLDEAFEERPQNIINDAIERLKESLLTCVLVSELMQIRGVVAVIKLRVLTPYGIDNTVNIATESCHQAFRNSDSVDSLSKPVDFSPEYPYYSLHIYEGNSKMMNAMPTFAYKAVDALKRAGRSQGYNNMILGQDIGDTILQNGTGSVTYTRGMVHYKIAESRSGKGVLSLNLVANAIKSGKILVYDDNKPDMSSALLDISPNAVAVNGSRTVSNPKDGTNINNHFSVEQYEAWNWRENIPNYLMDKDNNMMIDPTNPFSAADFYYLRLLMLFLGIMNSRANIKGFSDLDYFKIKTENGNMVDGGMVLFLDEINVFTESFNQSYVNRLINGMSANSQYFLDYQEYKKTLAELPDGKKEPKKPGNRPAAANYWNTLLLEQIKESAATIQNGKNAGYKNGEFEVTDIFVIGQTLPQLCNSNSNDFLPTRNKTNNNATPGSKAKGGSANNYGFVSPILAPLLDLVSPDLSIGNSSANYLNQNSKGSYASDKLNPTNRMFAYVPIFDDTTGKLIADGNENFAKSTPVYYKPLLVLVDHKPDVYFMKNALSFMDSAGLDIESVVEQNAQTDEEGKPIPGKPYDVVLNNNKRVRITDGYYPHKAIGLMGYLEYIGMSKEEVVNSLSRTADLFNYVVSEMGYNGTWREFIMDLRPEYLFSVKNVTESLRNKQPISRIVSETAMAREFQYVYPEAFTNIQSYDGDASDEDGFNGDSLAYNSLMKTLNGGIRDEDEEELTKQIHNSVDEILENPELLKYNDKVSADDLTEFDREDDLFFDDNIGLSRVRDKAYSKINEDDIPVTRDLNDLSQEELIEVIKALKSRLEGKPILNKFSDSNVGYGRKGVIYDEDGNPYKLDTSQLDVNSAMYDEILLEENLKNKEGYTKGEISYHALTSAITKKALDTARQKGGFKKLEVIDNTLVVNNTIIGLKLSENSIKGLPMAVQEDIKDGKLAPYFSWKVLRGTGITNIKVDSKNFVFHTIAPSMGYGTKFSVVTFFEDIRSLMKLTLANREYGRSEVLDSEFVSRKDDFYQPKKVEQAYRLTQKWLHDRRLNSWHGAADTWRRKDLNIFARGALSGIQLVGSGIAGTAEVGGNIANPVGKSVFRGIKKAYRDFKSMQEDSNRLLGK